MGKGKDKKSPRPPNIAPSIQEIPKTFYPDWSSYMHGYYGAMPPPFFPPFVPHPNTRHYPWGGQQSLARPFLSPIPYPIAFNPGSSRHVEQVAEPTSDPRQRNTAESGTRDKSNARDELDQEQDFGGFKEKHVDEGTAEVANDAAHHLRAEEEVDNDGRENFMNDGKDNDSLEEPKSGMLFSSKEELFAYYKQYGKQTGFGVMTQRSKREVDGSAKYLTLGCARGGKARNRTSNVSKPRPTTKTNCKAKINVMLVDGSWRVTTVENTHNHALNPFKSKFFRCNRNVDDVVKRQLDENDETGIQMNKSFNEVGELKNIQFIEKDCRNSIDKTRHLQLGKGGAKALCEYFERMQDKNDGFYVMMDLDDDSRLRNVFWADARSRVAYEYFGDVVTFDMTYLTNSYNMPLALILGVNHHGQLILLGVGLISSEDTNTFVWLFQTWLNCMDGRAPNAIITDQNRAIKDAITTVFPKTRCRYCLWHIMRKVPEELGSHAQYSHELKSALQQCVYDCRTCEDFEKSWDVLLNTYNLHDHAWLQSLYNERTYWAPVYLKDTFWAGMSTTQQNESMDAFFDNLVYSGSTLKEFVDKFDNALRKKVENENAADFNSFKYTIPCISHLYVEKKLQQLYTNSKFKEVQQEIMGMIYCNCHLYKTEGAISTYQVSDQVHDDFIKPVTFSVYFNEDECEAKCICGLFEMRGILCRHILTVFSAKNVQSLPLKYIVDRWRKDLKRRYNFLQTSYDDLSGKPDAHRYSCLLKRCYEVLTIASSSDDHFVDMMRQLDVMDEKYSMEKLH